MYVLSTCLHDRSPQKIPRSSYLSSDDCRSSLVLHILLQNFFPDEEDVKQNCQNILDIQKVSKTKVNNKQQYGHSPHTTAAIKEARPTP